MSQIEIINDRILDRNPISLEEAKSFLRVVHSYDNTLIASLLESSINFAENYLRQSLCRREIIGIYRDRNTRNIILSGGPITQIEYVKKVSNGEKLLEETIDYKKEGNNIIFSKLVEFDLEVKYSIGYSIIPSSIKHAVLIYLGLLYDKEAINGNSLQGVFSLLSPYKYMRII